MSNIEPKPPKIGKLKTGTKKIVTGIIGGGLLCVGIVAIPYPGPGWLIVFAALAILSTEFAWAGRVLDYAKGRYDTWEDWVKARGWPARVALAAFTCFIVVLTLWLLNGYGLINQWLGLGQDWVASPIPLFH